MDRQKKRRGSISPLSVVMFGALISAIITLTIIIIYQRKSPGPGPGIDKQEPEPHPALVDTSRIKESYAPGQVCEITVTATCDAKASSRDWFVRTQMDLHYVGKLKMKRVIESNDGATLIERIRFVSARNAGVFCNVQDLSLQPGEFGQFLLFSLDALTDDLLGVPEGTWSGLISDSSAKLIFNFVPGVKDYVNKMCTDAASKRFGFIDRLEGKEVRFSYINGYGVKEPIEVTAGGDLSKEQSTFISNFACACDDYLLKDKASKEGDEWQVRGEDMMTLLDPSLNASLSGKVTVRRGAAGVDAMGDPTATLSIANGILDIKSTNDSFPHNTVGRWSPRGEMTYSFANQLVTKAQFRGEMNFFQKWTHHVLVDAEFNATPHYVVDYTCTVVKP